MFKSIHTVECVNFPVQTEVSVQVFSCSLLKKQATDFLHALRLFDITASSEANPGQYSARVSVMCKIIRIKSEILLSSI